MLQSQYLTESDLKNFGFKSLGTNVRISSDARIYGQKNISIGNNVRIDDFTILAAVSGYISIGDYVFIGSACTVIGPSNLGEGCSIGAMSLVTKDLEPWGVYAGIPTSRRKERSRKLLDLEKQLISANRRIG